VDYIAACQRRDDCRRQHQQPQDQEQLAPGPDRFGKALGTRKPRVAVGDWLANASAAAMIRPPSACEAKLLWFRVEAANVRPQWVETGPSPLN
jgi:hypothetical protein